MDKTKKCPKCNSDMTIGVYAPVAVGGGRGVRWTDNIESGMLKFGKLNLVKTFQYACKDCGFIESYLAHKV